MPPQVAETLKEAVRTHCTCIDRAPPISCQLPESGSFITPAPVLVLFSGGVDSTLIAALAHQALPEG
jgi:asparagine synthetase B (glutamine-hydrolysing)